MRRFGIPRRRYPLAIAALYGVIGALWILFSDIVWSRLPLPFETLHRVQTLKGLLYVGLTAVLLWYLVRTAMSAVTRAEARYRQIFERSSSMCWIVDADTMRILDVNQAAAEFYGWSREELIGRSLDTINTLPPERIRELVEAARVEQRNFFVVRHRLRSGAVRDIEIHSTPIELDRKRVLFSILHDITDRLEAERQLAQSEANYRRALEQASDAIVVSDREGVILEANARTEELLGQPRERIEGRRLGDFITPEERERRPLNLRDLAEGGQGLAERRFVRRNGPPADVEISARDLGDGRFQAIMRDISERRRLELQLRQAQKMEAVGQLTGGIAHDLNNLLTVVLANSEMLAAGLPPGSELRHELAELQSASQSGALMIRKLLSFSRAAPLALRILDLGRLVDELAGSLRRLLPEQITLARVGEPAEVRVLADPAAVEQILLNLTANARDAMPQGGTLTLAIRRLEVERPGQGALPGWYGCLAVSDTGIGMDDSVRMRAFEPFFSTKPPGEGSGLGMFAIYGIAQQHGGFVELDSEPGRGTTVRVFLPLARDDQPLSGPAPAAEPGRGGGERILLVEDEEGLRKVAQRALEKMGYRVMTAADGVEALATYRSRAAEIDLIVTDVVMPRLGGVALYRTLRREGHPVRFLFTSGYSAQEIPQADLPEGEVTLLQKPWTIADLAHRVREALDRRRPEPSSEADS
jgi:PAS domain S-box-containing protein